MLSRKIADVLKYHELMKRFSAIGARRLQRTRTQILDMFGGVGFRADVRSQAH